MSDSVLDKYGIRSAASDTALGDTEQLEDCGSFGYLRGLHDRALFLELRFKSGDVSAFSYGTLVRIDFNRSDGIVLQFAGASVRITGQHLDAEPRPGLRLLSGILRHRITWIQEQRAISATERMHNQPSIEHLVVG
jgi:hypothetical protein